MVRFSLGTTLLASALLLGAACTSDSHCTKPRNPHHTAPAPRSGPTAAVAIIHATRGNTAQGIVRFTQRADGVRVVADVTGLKPSSRHGFHIHQYGDCTRPDGKSAGGHYNPDGHHHAGPEAAKRHAGDLGNLTSDANGKAHLELLIKNATVSGSHNPILGRGVIVHDKHDDLKSQPTGAAGPRIGCGVIGATR